MSVQTYPLLINIYKGENRILIIPVIRHEIGFSVDSDWYAKICNTDDVDEIGNGVINAVNLIKESPLSTIDLKAQENLWSWKKNSKYKSWVSFWKHNDCTRVRVFEEGYYKIYSLSKSKGTKGVYSEIVKEVLLPVSSTKEEVGKAVVDVFKELEEYDKKVEATNSLTKVIELLNDSKLTIIPPKDSHFTDIDDSGAAEIYQCYSYATSENAEPAAEFFIGIAPEIDCDLDIENVRASWEEYFGKADLFEMQEKDYGIFKYRVEMRNKESHKISYLLKQEEDLLLECGMEVHSPNRRKKTDEKLEGLFEQFALGCKM